MAVELDTSIAMEKLESQGYTKQEAQDLLTGRMVLDDGKLVSGIENGGSKGMFRVAGYWVTGVTQGTLFMLVPMVMIGISIGFMKRVINLGVSVGAD